MIIEKNARPFEIGAFFYNFEFSYVSGALRALKRELSCELSGWRSPCAAVRGPGTAARIAAQCRAGQTAARAAPTARTGRTVPSERDDSAKLARH